MKHFKKTLHSFIRYFDNKKGFSFIEILVAVTIFAILVIIALLNFTVSGQKSRDAKRTADIMGLRTAIELYNLGEGDYPDDSELDDCGGALTGLNGTYLETIPCDPETNSAYGYHFDTGTGTYYIGATMELANSQNQNCDELNSYLGLSSPSPSVAPTSSPSPSSSVSPSISPSPSLLPSSSPSPSLSPSPSPSASPTLEQLTCENSGGSWIPGGCDPCDATPCREVMTYGCDCGSSGCWSGSSCIMYNPADKLACEAASGTWTLFPDLCADICGAGGMCGQEENMNCACATFDSSYCWNGTSCQKP